MKNEENDQSNLFYKKSDFEALPVHSLISTQIGRAARRLHSRPALFHLIWFGCCSNMYLLYYGCSLLKYKQKKLFIYLLPVYISIICTCSTIFFCEAALLVFRAFCVGHAISAAAPGSRTMSSCPLSYVYLYILVQMLRLLSKSVLRACSKAVGLCHIWIFVHREPAPEFIAIRKF